MSWLAPAVLALLHALYRLVLVFKSVFRRDKEPLPLTAARSKTPLHLALVLVPNSAVDEETNERYMLESVVQTAGWCKVAGIRRLSVYDHEGILASSSLELRKRLLPPSETEEVEEDSPVECSIRYPLTPPPSDDAESRPLSPHSRPVSLKLGVTTIRFPNNTPKSKSKTSANRGSTKRRRVPPNEEKAEEPPLTLHILSYQSGKPAVAAAARAFLDDAQRRQPNSLNDPLALPSIQDLNAVLEGEHGFPSPDLMIVHQKPPVAQLHSPVQLGGFPPWQSRLTEIYCDPYPLNTFLWQESPLEDKSSIGEAEFRRALDEFASAEMRLGK
ncbi:hypothetical protein C8Q78DRAFT_147308 [Trametes maxima]|nr:hypothetical protein C8Q78DRAFT_147308 [Trametes maxima]